MISGSNLSIKDAVFYCDERLANTNIYNVTIAKYNYDTLYPDIYTVIKSYCKMCILQECSDYHCKLTFVTSVEPKRFSIILNKAIENIIKIRKLSQNQIALL